MLCLGVIQNCQRCACNFEVIQYVYENEDPSQSLKMLTEKLGPSSNHENSNLIFPYRHIKDTLNESRDPDRGDCDRYTSRFFLKHSFLEQAFDMLQEEGFELAVSCGTGTNSAGEIKPGMDSEESKWQHYNEFIFQRSSASTKI